MQTSGLPPSPSPAAHSTGKSSFAKASPAAEDFGQVMHRALSADESQAQTPAAPVKPSSGVIADATTEGSTAPTDKSDSSEKPTRPAKTLDAHQALPLVPIAGMVAAPIPAPVTPPVQPSGTAHETPVAKEVILPAPTNVTTIEAVDLKSSPTETATKATPAQDSVDTAADLKIPDTKSPTIPPGMIPTADAVATEELAAQTADTLADVADPIVAQSPDTVSSQKPAGKSASDPVSASPTGLRGTSAAKQDATMNKAEKTPKIAGATEQDLPGNTALGSDDSFKGQKLPTKISVHASEKIETVTASSPRALDSADSPIPVANSVAVTPASTIDTKVLERTHDIVALHAMRLNDTNSDTLHVVVKPGAGIQLALELRQSARGIEVSASLHKGDYDQLKQHWPDLQQRLEARGVRVGNLTTSENFTGAGHQQFNQSKQQSTQQDPLHTGAFAEFALAGAVTEAPAARAARTAAYRGWETWA